MKRLVVFPSLLAITLAGCAQVPHIQPQIAPIAPASLGLSGQGAPVAERWWDAFGDPQLGRLVDAGLTGNPSLAAALARLRAAQAQVGVEHAAQLPQVAIDAGVTRERFSDHYLIPPPYAGTDRNIATAQAGLGWDLDLFGRQRARVDMARSGLAAAGYDAEAARLAISTAIAQTYISLARADRQIVVARGFVATREHSLEFIRARKQSNLSSDFDLRSAETLLAQARQAQVRAERERDVLIHALAALTGRGADFYGTITPPTLALDAGPAVPDVLPADLIGRRPDLLAGQARIAGAQAGRKVARAEFLPNINLQAFAGLAAIGFGSFFTAGAQNYGGGAAIHLPIFEGGRLTADYKAATAQLDIAVADYNTAVLGAVRETADALTQVHSADADLAQQDLVVAGLRDTVRLDQVRISTGLGSHLDTIDSEFRLLEAEQALIDLQADALGKRVQLIAALGGGFDPHHPHITTTKVEKQS
jgi:NodT family efflux transporter outer membrane factor (OMF) lipoprotein